MYYIVYVKVMTDYKHSFKCKSYSQSIARLAEKYKLILI